MQENTEQFPDFIPITHVPDMVQSKKDTICIAMAVLGLKTIQDPKDRRCRMIRGAWIPLIRQQIEKMISES